MHIPNALLQDCGLAIMMHYLKKKANLLLTWLNVLINYVHVHCSI